MAGLQPVSRQIHAGHEGGPASCSGGRRSSRDFRPRSEDDLRKMRVDAYFDKPLEARALLAKVAELLDESADPRKDTP